MIDLAALLAGPDRASQVKVVREQGPSASTEELIRALRAVPPLGSVADELVHDLTHRGPGPCDAIAQALLADPLSPSAEDLGAGLRQLHAPPGAP